MTKITDSIIATNNSTIINARIKKRILNIENKKSFWSGFIIGILSSFIASGIWYLIEITYLSK